MIYLPHVVQVVFTDIFARLSSIYMYKQAICVRYICTLKDKDSDRFEEKETT